VFEHIKLGIFLREQSPQKSVSMLAHSYHLTENLYFAIYN